MTSSTRAEAERLADLTGRKFGRLLVKQKIHAKGKHNSKWLCVCECGAERTVDKWPLCKGETKSCGCLMRDTVIARNRAKALAINQTDSLVARIPLGDRGYALIDADLFDEISQFSWRMVSDNGVSYAQRRASENGIRRTVSMHRFIMNVPKGMFVDHINFDGLDNRRENLRICTHAQNMAHARFTKRNNKYRGVKADHLRWRAVINKEGVRYNLGMYDTQEEAALAYNKAASELHGEFAILNDVAPLKQPRTEEKAE